MRSSFESISDFESQFAFLRDCVDKTELAVVEAGVRVISRGLLGADIVEYNSKYWGAAAIGIPAHRT